MATREPSTSNHPPVRLRAFAPGDAEVCRVLFREAALDGSYPADDDPQDIDDIGGYYLASPGSYFWVAENADGEVVGMIGVRRHEAGMGEIRRLRVRQDHRRRGIGSQLLEAAIDFCNQHGYLKIELDTYIDREPAIRLFQKFHFRHNRTRLVGNRERHYFYLDIYHADGRTTGVQGHLP
jgi:ribosomal protein S18 acetylase RimI-like enzyme